MSFGLSVTTLTSVLNIPRNRPRRQRSFPIVVLWKLSRDELVAQSVEQRTFNAWVVGSIPTELTTSMATNSLLFSASQVTALHDRCTVAWHNQAVGVAPSPAGMERTLAEQHWANFELWHAEDA